MVVMAEFVPYSRRETYQLHNIPVPHMRNIARRSVKRRTSYANVVAQVLAEWCGIPFASSQRRRPGDSGWHKTSISVRVPVEVMDCLRATANEERCTIRSVMLNVLSDAFGLKRPPVTHVEPGSRPGRRKEK
jgi:hypothetical protein